MAGLGRRIGRLERRAQAPLPVGASARPLTGEDLAARLGVTAETVRRWAGQGMPSCGRHPSRPTWPVYDEAACRAWAAANQPQTALRPPTGEGAGTAPAAPEPKETMAELRARRLHLQCQLMRQRLIEERDQLLDADEVRAASRRHAEVVRERCGRLPVRTTERLAEAFGLPEDVRERSRRILAAEVGRALAGLRDDPLAAVAREAPVHPA